MKNCHTILNQCVIITAIVGAATGIIHKLISHIYIREYPG